MHTYRSLEDLGDERYYAFTIVSANSEANPPELEVSLVDNYPRLEFDQAIEEFEWEDNTLFKQATFLGVTTSSNPLTQNPVNSDSEHHESQHESGATSTLVSQENENSNPLQASEPTTQVSIGIEIKPGLVIAVPIDRFYVEGIKYQKGGAEFGLQRGDQVTLRIQRYQDQARLNVVRFTQADINALSDHQKIFYGKIDKKYRNDRRIKLKIEGYQANCFLHPDYFSQIESLSMLNRILLRFTASPTDESNNSEVYFKPVEPRILGEGDRLRVKYGGAVGSPLNRLKVTFGEGCEGYIYKSDVSYQPGFNLSQLQTKLGEEFENAVIKQSRPDASTRFSLKMSKPALQGMSYFLTQTFSETVRGVVLPRHHRQGKPPDYVDDYVDLEMQPNVIVRLPLIAWKPSLPRQKLKPGNVLVFSVSANQRSLRVNFELEMIEENNVLRYLNPQMLVRAELTYSSSTSKSEEYLWRFALPDYGDLEGKLTTKEPFRQDIGYRDLRLKIERLPKDPTHTVVLCDRSIGDQQQMLQVDSLIGNRVKLISGSGRITYLRDDYATYHIDYRITYLREQLQPGDILVATEHRGQFSLRYDQFQEKKLNKPLPFQFLRQFIETDSTTKVDTTTSSTITLTYVCTEQEDEQIFELTPGNLVAIPTTKFSFCGDKLSPAQFKRLLPGDRLTVILKQTAEKELEQDRVFIQHVDFCVLHDLHPNQLIEAQVQEIVETGFGFISGIIVRAKHLALEYFVNHLPSKKKAIEYHVGQDVWLIVDSIDPQRQTITLNLLDETEIHERLSQATFQEPLVVFSKFTEQPSHTERVDLNILNRFTRSIWLSQLTWTNPPIAKYIDDILTPEQSGLWLAIYINPQKDALIIRPKWIYERAFYKLKAHHDQYPNEQVQAQVLKCNLYRKQVDTVLLEIDGVRTLIPHAQLVQGAQHQPCLLPGMWVSVQVQRVHYDSGDAKQSILSIVSPGDFELSRTSLKQPFNAEVLLTLEHGLVFTVKQTLGYISNQELGWSEQMKAKDLFTPGEIIQVYHIEKKFSLKHTSQIQTYRSGQEITVQIHRPVEQGAYVKINAKQSYLFALIAYPSTDFEPNDDSIMLRLEDIDPDREILDFRVLSESTSLNLTSRAIAVEMLHQRLNRYYLAPLIQFDAGLEQLVRLLEQTDPTDRKKQIIDLIDQCNIPCTYANLRGLIRRFSKSARLWQDWAEFVDCHSDNEVIIILRQVARRIQRLDLLAMPAHLQPLCHYAIGITSSFETNPPLLPHLEALEHLLIAYHLDKSLDIAIALLSLYDKLDCWKLRRATLKAIVKQLSQNLHGLLKLPAPVEIDQDSYPNQWRRRFPGLNQSLSHLANLVKTIQDDYFYLGKLEDSENRFREIWDKTRRAQAFMPELPFNIALCRVLQFDYQGALDCLEQCKRILSNPNQRDRFLTLRQAYLQLNLYIHHQLGWFPQLQNILQSSYQANTNSSLETLLAYLFFASGKWQLCQDVLNQIPASTTSLKQNANALEYLLLRLYWQDVESEGTNLEHATDLQRLLMQKDYPELCPDRISNVYLMPQDQKNFDALLERGKQCDVPDYILHYRRRAESKHIQTLSDVALNAAKIDEAEQILQNAGDRNQIVQFYQDLLLNDRLDRFIKNQETQLSPEEFSHLKALSSQFNQVVESLRDTSVAATHLPDFSNQALARTSNRVLQLMERWLKSPLHYAVAGQKLSLFLRENLVLRSFCWLQPVLRQQLWQILDQSLDYGLITELIPSDLQVEDQAGGQVEDKYGQILAIFMALETRGCCTHNDTAFREVVDQLYNMTISTFDRLPLATPLVEQSVELQLLSTLQDLDKFCAGLVKQLRKFQDFRDSI